MGELIVKAMIGAAVVLIVDLLAQTKNFYFAGLVIMFPALTLVTHYIIGSARGAAGLQQTAVVGAVSVIPYLMYLLGTYVLAARFSLPVTLVGACIIWGVVASFVVFIYR